MNTLKYIKKYKLILSEKLFNFLNLLYFIIINLLLSIIFYYNDILFSH